MAKPCSLDLRERVVARVASGETVRSVAAAFDVSVSSVVKWSQRWRATGSAAAKPMGGRRRDVMASGRDYALARLQEQPSLALRTLRAELAERGVRVSYGALWHFVHAEGLSFKDRPRDRDAAPRHRPPPCALAPAPAEGRPGRFVFIDETWIKTNMAPLRGWGPRGTRLPGRAPHGHWRTLTFVGALRVDRIDAPCVFDGPINGELFRAYVEQVLVPTLAPGEVVVMDTLAATRERR